MLKFQYQTQVDTKSDFFQIPNQAEKWQAFKSLIDDPNVGFFHHTQDASQIIKAKTLAKKYESKKHFVQIGIGGSALGPKMLLEALGDFSQKTLTLLDNIDSDYIKRELDKIDITKALFYVVSKSGGTAETVALFSIVRNLLKKEGISEENFKNYFVFCSDPSSGQLRDYITKHNYDSLQVPSNIGGRFSVLTDVGVFPAYFFNIKVEDIFSGAEEIKKSLLSDNFDENHLLKTAATVAELYFHQSPVVDQTVMMPYSSLLKDFSAWFVQLWAESLGKIQHNKDASPVGLTPVPSYGATDQHSQMQLFMEGPSNKLIFLLDIENKAQDYPLASGLDLASAEKLADFNLNQLMEAELKGTIKALNTNKKHVIVISLDKLDEKSIGALILFFESLTALMGQYLEVDPFDQPGVEQGKIFAFEYLETL